MKDGAPRTGLDAVDPVFGGNGRPDGGAQTRFHGTGHHGDEAQSVLAFLKKEIAAVVRQAVIDALRDAGLTPSSAPAAPILPGGAPGRPEKLVQHAAVPGAPPSPSPASRKAGAKLGICKVCGGAAGDPAYVLCQPCALQRQKEIDDERKARKLRKLAAAASEEKKQKPFIEGNPLPSSEGQTVPPPAAADRKPLKLAPYVRQISDKPAAPPPDPLAAPAPAEPRTAERLVRLRRGIQRFETDETLALVLNTFDGPKMLRAQVIAWRAEVVEQLRLEGLALLRPDSGK